jgi:hypothetical protein
MCGCNDSPTEANAQLRGPGFNLLDNYKSESSI